jgi:phospholipase C
MRSHAIGAAAVCYLALALATACTAAAQTPFDKIKHVVIVIQENRTPDNLFQGIQRYLPKADIASSGVDSKGKVIPLTPLPLVTEFDIGHEHSDFVAMYRDGKMNGADLENCGNAHCPLNAPFHYVRPADVLPYWAIAENYGFANRMFQTNQGPSFPAHQFLFSGTSQPYPYSPLFAAENMYRAGNAGCIAGPDQRVYMIDASGKENDLMYPCFEHQTLADLLDRPPNNPAHPISWRYYGAGEGTIWMAPNAIDHICQAGGAPLRCNSTQWLGGDVVTWPAQVLIDIRKRTLRAVSWVTPTGQDSDHAGANDGSGPSWVASIVNEIGRSPYWNDTVILIVWDDWGGWYDHVAPPISSTHGYYEYGFRVPLLVVSAYTPRGYVSESRHDFGSILRFAEETFHLGRIPPGNLADADADDLADFFDFSRVPRPFVPIPTKAAVSKFLDRNRQMSAPDND